MASISIIGLGWLGKPLAELLIQNGHKVIGSTTNSEKQRRLLDQGIDTVLLKLTPHPEGKGFGRLFESDILFINIPPKSRTAPEDFYPEQVKYLIGLINQFGTKKIIFVSSTSVYPDINAEIDESYPIDLEHTGSKSIFRSEKLMRENLGNQLTIIRFAGLLGVDRIPGRYFSGKSNVVGDTPVNYIHQTDAVRLAAWVMEKGLWGEIYNGSAPIHPLRKEIYESNAKTLGFEPPKDYAPEGQSNFKIISPQKIMETGFEFEIPNPLDFWYKTDS